MRERTRNDDGPVHEWFKDLYVQNVSCDETPGDDTHTSGEFLSEQNSTIMHDVVTPGYKRISGRGGIVNSPMDRVQTILRDNPCVSTHNYEWEFKCVDTNEHASVPNWEPFVGYWEGIFPSTDYLSWDDLPAVPSHDEQPDIALAVTKAWAAINTTEVQSLVMLAEGHKTVASLISIFTRLLKIVKTVRKGEFWYLKRQISKKELKQRYMEMRYALRPLVYDAVHSMNALNTSSTNKAVRSTFRGVQTYSDSEASYDDELVESSHNQGTRAYTKHYEMLAEVEYSVRAGVLVEIENLNKLHIWGLTQPIESAWELVPFSFIVDWFLNVGKTIASFTPNFGTKALSSWYTVQKTTYQKVGMRYEDVSFADGTNPSYRWIDFSKAITGCYIDKTIISNIRVPEPSRRILPTFNVRLDTLKLIDLLIICEKLWTGGSRSGLRI
jgi:hypothetical protein